MFDCMICGGSFNTEKELHLHLGRVEKVKLENYYPEWFPRYSLKTSELIKFKTKDQYMTALFNGRVEMIGWLQENKGKAPEIIQQLIQLRKDDKSLRFAPDTVYGRSCLFPPPTLVQYLGIDYNQICKNVGLTPIRNYNQILTFGDENKLNIIIDNREQTPFSFPARIKIIKNSLSFGDYSTSSEYFKNLYIERKSLPDLCGSLSGGFERLCVEFDKAVEFGANIVVVVEEDLNLLFRVGKTNNTKKIRATPEFLLSRLRDIIVKYKNFQFLFCKDRQKAAQSVVKLLTLQNDIDTIDCQFYMDTKTL